MRDFSNSRSSTSSNLSYEPTRSGAAAPPFFRQELGAAIPTYIQSIRIMAFSRRFPARYRVVTICAAALAGLGLSGAQNTRTIKTVSAADEAQFEQAMHLLDQGQSAQARPLLETLNRRYPGRFEITESLGLLYASTGDLQQAMPLLQTGVRVAPNNATAHANLGTAYFKLGRIDPAVAELTRAAKLDPSNPETQNTFGQALMLAKDPCKAADAFTAALQGSMANK